jgi:hypothetical protein
MLYLSANGNRRGTNIVRSVSSVIVYSLCLYICSYMLGDAGDNFIWEYFLRT